MNSARLVIQKSLGCPILRFDAERRALGWGMRSLLTRFLASTVILAGLVLSAKIVPAQTRADAEKDPVLKAMLTELDRSMSQLQLPGFAKPFFIQYRIEEVDEFTTTAEFGASEGASTPTSASRASPSAWATTKPTAPAAAATARSSLPLSTTIPSLFAPRFGTPPTRPTKMRSRPTRKSRRQLKQVQTPPQADDFSQEKPIISLADPVKLHLDENAWAERIARASGLYRTDPAVSAGQRDIEYSTASFRARATTTWLVTSEGTIVRKSAAEYQESFAAGTQAPDGMRLDRSYGSSGISPNDLDSEAVFNKHAVDEIVSLADLRKAPLVEEEYHGPLLLQRRRRRRHPACSACRRGRGHAARPRH